MLRRAAVLKRICDRRRAQNASEAPEEDKRTRRTLEADIFRVRNFIY